MEAKLACRANLWYNKPINIVVSGGGCNTPDRIRSLEEHIVDSLHHHDLFQQALPFDFDSPQPKKACAGQCGLTLPLSLAFFRRSKSSKDGFSSHCLKCARKATRSQMVAENNMKRAQDLEYQARVNANIRAAKNTPEGQLRASLGMTKAYESPERRALQSQVTKRSYEDHPELRQIRSQTFKEFERDEAYRASVSRAQKISHADPAVRQKLSESISRYYATTEGACEAASKRQKEVMSRPESIERNRNIMLKLWKESPEKFLHTRGKMNKAEEKLFTILGPLGFEFEPHFYTVGDRFLLPDFVKGKLVIELQGRHWHTEQETEERGLLLNSIGKTVLFIWDYEISSKIRMKIAEQKILGWLDFHQACSSNF